MAEMELGYGKNVAYIWVIRSVTSWTRYGKEYGRHSETERVLVYDDGL